MCRRQIAAALVLLATMAACTDGGSSVAGGSGSGTANSTTSRPAAALVDAAGFQRLNALPQPVAAQDVADDTGPEPRRARVEVVQAVRVGAVLRVVLAWSRPTSGGAASADRMRSPRPPLAAQYEIGLRVYDPAAGTLAEPLRTGRGDCLCSTNTTSSTSGDKQSLFWADLPAPRSDEVTLLLGRDVPALPGVRVTDGSPLRLPGDLPDDLAEWVVNRPPDVPGEGAAAPVVGDVRRNVRTFGGAEDNQVGDQADVSVPSDVLFALDSASLTGPARAVLAAAAPRLAVAARGQRVRVVGHTDDQGSDSYNAGLSRRRAAAVVAALAPRLRPAGITLAPEGRGESEPVVPNVDAQGAPIPENRQRNRRVSFAFKRARGGAGVAVDVPRPLPTVPTAGRTTASPKVTGALVSVASRSGQVRMDVTGAQRSGSDLWVRLAFTSIGAKAPWGANSGILDQSVVGSNATLANVSVVDPVARTVSSPLTVGRGVCLCTEDMGSGAVYENPLTMWALFPAPLPASTTVTLRVPGFGQVPGVPVR
jgi:outer membrane protein OmpA-like peptidoglycan-associated protein